MRKLEQEEERKGTQRGFIQHRHRRCYEAVRPTRPHDFSRQHGFSI